MFADRNPFAPHIILVLVTALYPNRNWLCVYARTQEVSRYDTMRSIAVRYSSSASKGPTSVALESGTIVDLCFFETDESYCMKLVSLSGAFVVFLSSLP